MTEEIRILHLEDSASDAELIARELREAGLEFSARIVQTQEAYETALGETPLPTLVLIDPCIPGVDGLEAIARAQARVPAAPVIVVTGTTNEKTAAACLRAGAADYVLKDRLGRLSAAVEAAIAARRADAVEKQAERALRAAEERFRILVETVDGIFWEADPKTFRFTYVSPRAERVLGFPTEKWLKEPTFWVDHIHPDDRQEAVTFCVAATQQGRPHQLEYRMVAADGRVVWLRDFVTVVVERGEPRTLRGVMVDVTAQHEAEERLRESEVRFREIANAIQEVFWATDPGRSRILYVSPAYEAIWGRPCEELYREPYAWTEAIHPEDRERVLEAVRAKQAIEAYDEVYRIVRPDGSLRWIRDRAFPVRNAAGQVVRIAGIAEDVTALRRAEEELRDRVVRETALAELGRLALVIEEQSLFFDRVAALIARTVGADLVAILALSSDGRTVRPIGTTGFPPDSPRPAVGVTAESQAAYVLAAGGPVVIEDLASERRFRPAPPLVEAGARSGVSTPIPSAAGAIGILGAYSRALRSFTRGDLEFLRGAAQLLGLVLARHRAEEAARQKEAELWHAQKMEAIGRLAGGVAHDFNNLLTGIRGFAELMLLHLREGDPLQRHAEEIKKAAVRAASLTRKLLAFSRKEQVMPCVLDLNALLVDLEAMLRRVIGEDIDLSTHLEPGLLRVLADSGQIEQVVMNLAVNARDAMPSGGRLTIETRNVRVGDAELAGRPGPHVLLSVADTGSGMDKETLARLFEPFFTTKPAGRGTGLGLSTVFGIVEQSGGFIRVESEKGQGATFRIYLPGVEAAEKEETPAASPDPLPGGRETILVTEDDPVVREFVVSVLRSKGYRVLEAGLPHEAVLICERHPGPIHLLLSDVVMPDMSGPDLHEAVSSLRPGLPALFISGYTGQAMPERIANPRGARVIEKPFTLQVLLRAVRAALGEGDPVPPP